MCQLFKYIPSDTYNNMLLKIYIFILRPVKIFTGQVLISNTGPTRPDFQEIIKINYCFGLHC